MKPNSGLMRLFAVLLALVLLTGCAAEPAGAWVPVRAGEATQGPAKETAPVTAPPTEALSSASSTQAPTTAAPEQAPTELPTEPVTTCAEPTTEPAPEPETESAETETLTRSGAAEPSSAESDPAGETQAEVTYVANKKTKKFHTPDCSSVTDMKEDNKLYWSGTREDLISEGYVPCKRCSP